MLVTDLVFCFFDDALENIIVGNKLCQLCLNVDVSATSLYNLLSLFALLSFSVKRLFSSIFSISNHYDLPRTKL